MALRCIYAIRYAAPPAPRQLHACLHHSAMGFCKRSVLFRSGTGATAPASSEVRGADPDVAATGERECVPPPAHDAHREEHAASEVCVSVRACVRACVCACVQVRARRVCMGMCTRSRAQRMAAQVHDGGPGARAAPPVARAHAAQRIHRSHNVWSPHRTGAHGRRSPRKITQMLVIIERWGSGRVQPDESHAVQGRGEADLARAGGRIQTAWPMRRRRRVRRHGDAPRETSSSLEPGRGARTGRVTHASWRAQERVEGLGVDTEEGAWTGR